MMNYITRVLDEEVLSVDGANVTVVNTVDEEVMIVAPEDGARIDDDDADAAGRTTTVK